ncbi:uncharacterized protein ASCRUDRAFT_74366 [Ascoidea rubescens DSM 1968]|uniref:Uncharacterized protein n=1 Tax=Ascoidea rubescens DSM 1968 TaxID=1344418 RepID=A0A1D2VMX3_9ASCO|nr:hypothetical protein ASCRUDRAFT_74366 [Ascoidea rubescens DSM 1968]ODV62917.1 hypothetical protein ASCRUDRAFT_74366 [Ascoidea rubescens DSM 1968]
MNLSELENISNSDDSSDDDYNDNYHDRYFAREFEVFTDRYYHCNDHYYSDYDSEDPNHNAYNNLDFGGEFREINASDATNANDADDNNIDDFGWLS